MKRTYYLPMFDIPYEGTWPAEDMGMGERGYPIEAYNTYNEAMAVAREARGSDASVWTIRIPAS